MQIDDEVYLNKTLLLISQFKYMSKGIRTIMQS